MLDVRTSRRAFTLIELLVVVSIIALIIAMLMPALAKSRESAKLAICNSNLAGLGKGQFAYTMDFDGFYTMSTEWVWSKSNYPDGTPAPNRLDPTVVKNITAGTLYSYYPAQEAFVCPVAVDKLPRQNWWVEEDFVRSYVQNGEAGPSASQEWIDKGWTEQEAVDTLDFPNDFAIFVEENTYSVAGWNTFNNRGMNDALFRLQPFNYDLLGSFHNTDAELGDPDANGYYDQDDPLNSGISYALMADGHVQDVDYKGKIVGGPFNNTSYTKMWCKDGVPVQRD